MDSQQNSSFNFMSFHASDRTAFLWDFPVDFFSSFSVSLFLSLARIYTAGRLFSFLNNRTFEQMFFSFRFMIYFFEMRVRMETIFLSKFFSQFNQVIDYAKENP